LVQLRHYLPQPDVTTEGGQSHLALERLMLAITKARKEAPL
jgi:hypothetical protein